MKEIDEKLTPEEDKAIDVLVASYDRAYTENKQDGEWIKVEYTCLIKKDGNSYKITIERIDDEDGIKELLEPPVLIDKL